MSSSRIPLSQIFRRPTLPIDPESTTAPSTEQPLRRTPSQSSSRSSGSVGTSTTRDRGGSSFGSISSIDEFDDDFAFQPKDLDAERRPRALAQPTEKVLPAPPVETLPPKFIPLDTFVQRAPSPPAPKFIQLDTFVQPKPAAPEPPTVYGSAAYPLIPDAGAVSAPAPEPPKALPLRTQFPSTASNSSPYSLQTNAPQTFSPQTYLPQTYAPREYSPPVPRVFQPPERGPSDIGFGFRLHSLATAKAIAMATPGKMGTRTPQMLEYERQAEERAREADQMAAERERMMEEMMNMQTEQDRISREEYEMKQYYEAEELKHREEVRLHQEEVRRHQKLLREHTQRLRDHDASSEAFAKVIAMPARQPRAGQQQTAGATGNGFNGNGQPQFNDQNGA